VSKKICVLADICIEPKSTQIRFEQPAGKNPFFLNATFFGRGGSIEKTRKTTMGEGGSKMVKKRPRDLCTAP